MRHSVFIVGNAGTGKSQIWKVLNRTYHNQKRKPIAVDLNPKAVTNDELFGIINPATREWKDGLFSTIMRDLSNMTSDGKNEEYKHKRKASNIFSFKDLNGLYLMVILIQCGSNH